ncbi:FBP domain-containing protein [Amycolatopsis benzoatilytica]|uniref:FBP domain-containing protein n=1 Tax=Amycolatopsis benzoatilytica TaxID=346045 RepID=UPI000377EB44|nr:FBP domain-containing protein [Amycolatopsis benzoatilytica]
MEPIAEHVLRASFINASKGEAARMNLPRDFAETAWSDLDFLGWHDPGARERAWLVAERDGQVVGLSLRVAPPGSRGFTARSMCSMCLTTRTGGGVTLMTARKTGAAGRRGNSVGQYVCADLACSLYVRGRKQSAGAQFDEAMTVEDKIARLRLNLEAFLDKVAA